MKRRRREVEEFSLSFLDVICCGFGAIILLLMVTKTVEPIVIEESSIDLEGQVIAKREAIEEIRGQTKILNRQIENEKKQLIEELTELARLRHELSEILSQYAMTKEQSDLEAQKRSELAAAKQDLTEEMTRLLGSSFTRRDKTIGGITVDSEYIIFVIDTSGSMQNYAWGAVVRKLDETLRIYPEVKGIQIMNDMGDYMFPQYRDRWIEDSPMRRRAIMTRLRTWRPFSNSSPVEGIEKAVRTYWAPDKKISIYVFGDDFQGDSVEQVVDTVDRINRADENGNRRVRIHAIGFPVIFQAGNTKSVFQFASLMRELTSRNNGTFVGLPQFQ
jgi:hypothetical protein